jgi:hypothetical protein
LTSCPSSGSECVRVQTLLEQAEFWGSQNEPDRARRLFLEAMALDSSPKSRWGYARFLCQIGDDASAIEQLTTFWNEAKRQNQFQWAAAACEGLGVIYRRQGRWAISQSFQQQAIASRLRSQAAGTQDDLPVSEFLAIANDAILRGNLSYAEPLVNCALASAEEGNCPGEIADALGTQGAIYLRKGQRLAAWQAFLKAYFFHCRAKDPEGRLVDLLNLAAVSRGEGQWELTRKLLRKACAEATLLNHPMLRQKAEYLLEEAERVLAVSSRVPEWN